MTSEFNKRYENKPLKEYRLKVQRTRWFLNRFYTPEWLQRPTKTNLIVSLVFWVIGVSVVLFYRIAYQTEVKGNFLINLMLITTTISIIGMCFSYYRGRQKDKNAEASNKQLY